MPITPFHLGPALIFGLLLFNFVSLPVFVAGNVILDLEGLYNLVTDSYPRHAFFHSYVGAALVAIPLALVSYAFRKKLDAITAWFGLKQKSSFRTILPAAILGTWLHVFVDTFSVLGDMKPFWPFEGRLFPVDYVASMVFCVIALLLGLLVFYRKSTWFKRKIK